MSEGAASGWYVYILRCADASLYTGIARDVAARVARHNAGKGAAYTRARRPVELVHSEPAADRSSALRREAAIKRLPVQLKRMLAGQPHDPPATDNDHWQQVRR